MHEQSTAFPPSRSLSHFFLCFVGAAGQGMEQPAMLMSVEGTFVQVNCTYSASGFNGLSWYQQHEGQGPVFLS